MATIVLNQGAAPQGAGAITIENGGTTGYITTAESVGTVGLSLIDDPPVVGTVLHLKSLSSASSALTLTDDLTNNAILLSVVPIEISHTSIADIGATPHATIDVRLPTADQKDALNAAAAPSAGNPFVTEGDLSSIALGASNVNLEGIGVFAQKTGATLEFRGVRSTSSAIVATLHSPTNTVSLALNPSSIDHGSLGNIGTLTHGQIEARLPTINQRAALGAGTGADPYVLTSTLAARPYHVKRDLADSQPGTIADKLLWGNGIIATPGSGLGGPNYTLSVNFGIDGNQACVGNDPRLPTANQKAALGAGTGSNPYVLTSTLAARPYYVALSTTDVTFGPLNQKFDINPGFSKTVITGTFGPKLEFEPIFGNSSDTFCEGNDARLPSVAQKAAMDASIAIPPPSGTNPWAAISDVQTIGSLLLVSAGDTQSSYLANKITVSSPITAIVEPGGFGERIRLEIPTNTYALYTDSRFISSAQQAALDKTELEHGDLGIANWLVTQSELAATITSIENTGSISTSKIYTETIGQTAFFKGIRSLTTAITVVDFENVEIHVDLAPENIPHGSLAGVGTNSHGTIDLLLPTSDQKGALDAATAPTSLNPFVTEADIAISPVTASNLGTGAPVFKQKIANDLQFRSLGVGPSLTMSVGLSGDTIIYDVNEANVNHDNLASSGTTTHAALDLHVADTSIHYAIGSAVPEPTRPSTGTAGISLLPARQDHVHQTPTGIPGATEIGDLSDEGSALTYARSDHQHAVVAPSAPIGLDADTLSATGISVSPSRADHTHSLATGPATSVGFANSEGTSAFLARADHDHLLGSANLQVGTINDGELLIRSGTEITSTIRYLPTSLPPTDIEAGTIATAGLSAELARQDHAHGVATASAGSIAAAGNTEGTSTELARADHSHAIEETGGGILTIGAVADGEYLKRSGTTLIGDPGTSTPLSDTAPLDINRSAAAAGVALEASRQDHKHDIATAAPTLGIGAANAVGSASTLARSDHDHLLRESGGQELVLGAIADGKYLLRSGPSIIGTDLFDAILPSAAIPQTGAVGIANVAARRDHVHDLSVSAPTQGIGSANAVGTGTDLALATHDHLLRESGGQDLSIGAVADSQFLRRSGASIVGVTSYPCIPSDIIPSAITTAVGVPGSSLFFSRADHAHQILVGAGTVGIGAGNFEGVDTSLARADHNHALRESGGQDLTLGTIADRELLHRSGTGIIGEKIHVLVRSCLVNDHFISSNIASGSLGSAGWATVESGAGTNIAITAEAGHPGVLELTGGNSASSYVAVFLSALGSSYPFIIGGTNPIYCECLVKGVSNFALPDFRHVQIGLIDEVNATGEPANGVFVEFDPTDSLNWQLHTRATSVSSKSASSIPVLPNLWYRVGFLVDVSGTPSVTLYINGVASGASISTNIPTTGLAPCMRIGTLGTIGAVVRFDYFLLAQEGNLES